VPSASSRENGLAPGVVGNLVSITVPKDGACRCRRESPIFADLIDNQVLLDFYARNAASMGRIAREPKSSAAVVGSTDMGNVSYAVPSIHPMIKVAPDNVAIHTPEFAHYAESESGDQAVLDGAKIMAMTVADLWLDPGATNRAADELAQSLQ